MKRIYWACKVAVHCCLRWCRHNAKTLYPRLETLCFFASALSPAGAASTTLFRLVFSSLSVLASSEEDPLVDVEPEADNDMLLPVVAVFLDAASAAVSADEVMETRGFF